MMDITFPLTVRIDGVLDALKGRVRLLDPTDLQKTLSKLVTGSSSKQDLRVSIGEGDFLASWIRRLCEAYPGEVQISRLFIARLADAYADQLESQGLLRPGFSSDMRSHVDAIRRDPGIAREGIQVRVENWSGIPPFHGWIYGDRALIARWAINDSGHLHVNTMMVDTKEKKHPDAYRRALEMFPDGTGPPY